MIATAFLLPLAIGMVIWALLPKVSERFADRLLAIAGVVLIAAGVALPVAQWKLFLEVRWEGMATLVGLMLIALAIGHALGGPNPEERTTLAIACATGQFGKNTRATATSTCRRSTASMNSSATSTI